MEERLARLVDEAKARVERARAQMPFAELEAMVAQADPARNFFAAATRHASSGSVSDPGYVSLIAEVVRPGPFPGSAIGPLPPQPGGHQESGPTVDPVAVARRYHAGGAAAVSCVTEGIGGFGLATIESIRGAVPIPVMRRDVIVDPWQLWESRAAGADAVLLMSECLTEGQIVDMQILAQQMGLTTVLEVRSMDSLLRVRPYVGFPHQAYGLLSINNRDMAGAAGQDEGDVAGTLRLLDLVDDRTTLISEGGVRYRADVLKLAGEGVRTVLCGAELVAKEDPGAAVAELLGVSVR
ncbi:MAG: hypothetical protein KF745_07305 [Phycisphaeraceae bacterium]|nr:hypothetical protein [Phycisphaeraceae bacterium]